MPDRKNHASSDDNRLLAVDLGLKMGMALYGRDGRLLRFQNRKITGMPQLKALVNDVLKNWEPSLLYLEGGGNVEEVWTRHASKRDIPVVQVHAAAWRETLLLPREMRKGVDAKRHAVSMALRIVEWSDSKQATAMRHDAAEAIVFGLWAVLREGWLEELPRDIAERR